MDKRTLCLFILLMLASVCPGQVWVVGNHTGDTDPMTEGWNKVLHSTETHPASEGPLSPDPDFSMVRSWRIVSGAAGDGKGGELAYKRHFATQEEYEFIMSRSWKLSVRWRLKEHKHNFASSNFVGIRLTNGWYQMRLGHGKVEDRAVMLLADGYDDKNPIELGDDGYYTTAFLYNPDTSTVDFYVNDVLTRSNITRSSAKTVPATEGFFGFGVRGTGNDSEGVAAYANVRFETIGGQANPNRPSNFGLRWTWKNPLTLMGLTQRTPPMADTRYRDAGFNAVLAFKDKDNGRVFEHAHKIQNLPWHSYLGDGRELDANLIADIRRRVDGYPGCAGISMWDENWRTQMFVYRRIVAWLHREYPHLLAYSASLYCAPHPIDSACQKTHKYWNGCLLGTTPSGWDYEDYLRDYIGIVNPDVLVINIYPWKYEPVQDVEYMLYGRYFHTLESVRDVGTKSQVPYWGFVQAMERKDHYLRPSESDMRMQIFTKLAYGFTGILYFTWDPVWQGSLLKFKDTDESEYVTTGLYDYARLINREITNLGKSLPLLENTGTRYLAGRHLTGGKSAENTYPYKTTAWEASNDPDPYVANIAVKNPTVLNDGLPGDIMIGYFKPAREDFDGPDYSNQAYFMLVNLLRQTDTSPADTRQSITVEFDFGTSGITSLQRLSRQTGRVETIPLVHLSGSRYRFTLELPGGTGDLFKYQTGAPFVLRH